MIDVVTVGAGGGSIACDPPRAPSRSARSRPAPTPARSATARAAPSRRSPTPTSCWADPSRTCSAARSRSTSTRPGDGIEAGGTARARRGALRHRHPRDLGVEPGERAAPGQRQARPRRARLHAHDLRRLGVAARLPPRRHPRPRRGRRAAEPRQRVGVRPAHRRREERLRADRSSPGTPASTAQPSRRSFDELTDKAAAGARHRGLPARRSTTTCAPPTCATSARPSRSRRGPGRAVDEAYAAAVADAFHDEHRSSTATTSATTRASRSSGSTCGSPASARSRAPSSQRHRGRRRRRRRPRAARQEPRPVCFDAEAGYVDTDVYWRPDLRAGDTFSGPAIVEEFGSTVPVHPGFTVRVDAIGNLVVTKEAGSDAHSRHGRPRPHGLRARQPAHGRGDERSTRSSSRSSRAPSPASRWRSRPPSRARAARP